MNTADHEIETSAAHLKRTGPDQLEVAYRPGCTLNSGTLQEVAEARRALMGTTPYGMLSTIPEDVGYAVGASNVDHLAQDRKEGHLRAIAVVAHADMMEMVLKLYFAYFPQLSCIKVTPSEADARQWLKAQLKEFPDKGTARG